MTIIGIDPGLGGAVACVDDVMSYESVTDTPTYWVKRGKGKRREYDVPAMIDTLDVLGEPDIVVLEAAIVMPKQGAVSARSIGYGFGLWRGLLAARSWRVEIVQPQVWKRALGLTRDKGASRLKAQQLYPHVDLGKSKDEGRAEALLLAEYGRRLMGGDS